MLGPRVLRSPTPRPRSPERATQGRRLCLTIHAVFWCSSGSLGVSQRQGCIGIVTMEPNNLCGIHTYMYTCIDTCIYRYKSLVLRSQLTQHLQYKVVLGGYILAAGCGLLQKQGGIVQNLWCIARRGGAEYHNHPC